MRLPGVAAAHLSSCIRDEGAPTDAVHELCADGGDQRTAMVDNIVSASSRSAVDTLTASLVQATDAAPTDAKRCGRCGATWSTRKRVCGCGHDLPKADEARKRTAEVARSALASIGNIAQRPLYRFCDETPRFIRCVLDR